MKTSIKLNRLEKENLYNLMRTEKNFNVRKKAHLIILSSKNIQTEELSSIFEIEKSKLRQIIENWKTKKFRALFES